MSISGKTHNNNNIKQYNNFDNPFTSGRTDGGKNPDPILIRRK